MVLSRLVVNATCSPDGLLPVGSGKTVRKIVLSIVPAGGLVGCKSMPEALSGASFPGRAVALDEPCPLARSSVTLSTAPRAGVTGTNRELFAGVLNSRAFLFSGADASYRGCIRAETVSENLMFDLCSEPGIDL
jgi:hypothetical protein